MHSVISKNNIPVAGPSITKKEIQYVMDAVTNGWYESANEYIDRFENAFAKYLGRKYAISLPSCTSGLHLSLLALGIGPGDEVIAPDSTWIATAAPINYVGATPIFADSDPTTWCVSASTLEKRVTSKTKAIIVVNLYGHMPEWQTILALSLKYNIPIIEDAAESIGSRYHGKLAGSFGLSSCFSFHGSKTLTTGEGGMLVTDDEKFYHRCMMLRDHGRTPGDIMFRNIEVGYKYKMSALQAALGLAQLERIEELVSKKREIFSWYRKAFEGVSGISLNPDCPDVYNSYWMSTILFDHSLNIDKSEMIQALKKQGIHTRPYFDPLSSLKAYEIPHNHYQFENIVAYDIARRGINLPSALNMEQSQAYEVRTAIISIMAEK